MSTVAFTEFLPEVLPECTGVPHPVAVNAVRNACFDFCNETLWWNETQDSYTIPAGTTEIDIDVPVGAIVAGVLSANIGNATLYPSSFEAVEASFPQWSTQVGEVVGFFQPTRGSVRFVRIPQNDLTARFTVAYAPSRSADSIDKGIYDYYLETIKFGALWKLKRMFGTPWADPVGSQYADQQFWMGVGAATAERQRGNSRSVLRVASRLFV